MSNAKQGDKCWVKGTKKHYGICTGIGPDGDLWFVHNTREGGAVHTTRKGFSGNHEIHVEQRAKPGFEVIVATRAMSLVGQKYDLLSFNCEHLANLAANGTAESKQVRAGATLVASVSLFALLVSAVNENGTSVGPRGYRRDRRGRFAARKWW